MGEYPSGGFFLFLLGLFVDKFEKFYIERLTTVRFNLRKTNPNILKYACIKSNLNRSFPFDIYYKTEFKKSQIN